MDITVNWSEKVTWTTTVPSLSLSNGATAVFDSSSNDSKDILFKYTVGANSSETTDLTISNYNGTIQKLGVNEGGFAEQIDSNDNLTNIIVIDVTVATVTNVTSIDGNYKKGDIIPITISFSENVFVIGQPYLSLNSTNTGVEAKAFYISGNGKELLFNYDISENHNSADLDYINTTSLGLNSGSIKDIAGNDVSLTLPVGSGSLGANGNIVVDGIAPTFSVSSSPGIYSTGDVIDIITTWSEDVNWQSNPSLTLDNGATASYSSSNNSKNITFKYTVLQNGDTEDLKVTGYNGSIKDGVDNVCDNTLTTPLSLGGVIIVNLIQKNARKSGITAVQLGEIDFGTVTLTNGKGILEGTVKTAMRTMLDTTTDVDKKRKKRSAVIKFLFEKNNSVKKMTIPMVDLGLPLQFKKTNAMVVKAGETFIPSSELSTVEGFYCVLEDTEEIQINLTHVNLKFKRNDEGTSERYYVTDSLGASVSKSLITINDDDIVNVTGKFTESNTGGYLASGDIVKLDGQIFFISSIGDGGTGTPEIVPVPAISIASDNSTVTITFDQAVFTDTLGVNPLVAADISLNITGGIATLNSVTPLSLTTTDNITFVLEIDYSTDVSFNGTEVLTVNPSSATAIYNAAGTVGASTQQNNNTITLLDVTSPTIFTLSSVITTGPSIVTGYWNSHNTGLNVIVPIDGNDITLNGGTIQLKAKVANGAWVDLGGSYSIISSDFGTSKTMEITESEFENLSGFIDDVVVEINVEITDISNNQTTGTQSTSITIDRNIPIIDTISTSWGAHLNSTEKATTQTVTVGTSGVQDNQTLTITLNSQTYTGTVIGNSTTINISSGVLQTLSDGISYTMTADVKDVAGNSASQFTSSSFLVDFTSPGSDQVGSITAVGGTVVNNAYNSTNTGLNIFVPIANDLTLTGGSVQLRISTDGGSFEDLSGTYPIVIGDLGNNRKFGINDSDFTALVSEGQTASFATIITDVAGNLTTFTASTQTIVRDETLPTLESYDISTNHYSYLDNSRCRVGSIVTLTFISDGTVNNTAVQFRVNGTDSINNAIITNSGNNWQATLTLDNSDTNGEVTYTISSFTDLVGNIGTAVNSGSTGIIFDNTPPTITSITLTTSDVSANAGGQNTIDLSNAMVGDVITLTFTSDKDLNFTNGTTPFVTFTTTLDSTSTGGTQNAIINTVSYLQTNSTTYVASYITHFSDIGGDISFNIIYEDLAGNESNSIMGTVFPTVRFDKIMVALTSLDVSSNNLNSDYAKKDDILTFNIKTDNRIQTPELTFNNALIPNSNISRIANDIEWDSADEWSILYMVKNDDPAGDLYFSFDLYDLAGNKLNVTQDNLDASNVKIQTMKPRITLFAEGLSIMNVIYIYKPKIIISSIETLISWDPGATGNDVIDGDITDKITKTYNWDNVDSYSITYKLKNSSGIEATEMSIFAPILAESMGDPYIIPINGDIYKLPDLTASYRLYELDNIFINAKVDKATEEMQGRMLDFYRKLGGDNDDSQEIILNGYYYHKFFISSEGHQIMLDLTQNKIIVEEQDKLYFNLSIEEKEEKKHLLKMGGYIEFSISWTTEKYGNMHITIDLYKNPQIDNGIKLLSGVNNNSIGLLIRNYEPSTMEIEDVTTLKTSDIVKKLKNNPQLADSNVFEDNEVFEVFKRTY